LTAPFNRFKVTLAMAQKRSRVRGPVTVRWDNPTGPDQGITIERVVYGHTYSRRVGPRGFLSPTEAGIVLNVTREFIYHLIWSGKLRTVTREGKKAVPLSAIKGYERKHPKGRGGVFPE